MKDNANPTVFAVQKTNENESFVATTHLKRLDCQEAAHYDSLFHLNPAAILTPLERSVQSALASIDHGYASTSNKADLDPLGILHSAGIKTRVAVPTSTASTSTSTSTAADDCNATTSMNLFKPSKYTTTTTTTTTSTISGKETDTRDSSTRDTITQREIFDIIRNIQDPEHPLHLEQLNVVKLDHVQVHDTLNDPSNNSENNDHSTIDIRFTPTIPHCSMATLIGLCIRVKLLRSVPSRFKVTVRIEPGTHASELAVNRQLNDKERVIAALENVHLLSVVNKCIANGMKED